jgi:hypothetical protein
MGSKAVAPKVLEWLHRNENIRIHLSDIVRDTGLTKEQVLNALGNLRRREGLDIETLVRGEAYAFRTTPAKPNGNGKRVFEEIGVSKDGRIIIQDVDGNLYETREL